MDPRLQAAMARFLGQETPQQRINSDFTNLQYPQEGPYASQYDPTTRDRMAKFLMGESQDPARENMVKGLLGSTGTGHSQFGLADVTPLGAIFGAQEAERAGDPQGFAMSLLGPGGFKWPSGGFTAYHGTPRIFTPEWPHAPFGKFDPAEVGTTRGVITDPTNKGWGHYLSTNPREANTYRVGPNDPREFLYQGSNIPVRYNNFLGDPDREIEAQLVHRIYRTGKNDAFQDRGQLQSNVTEIKNDLNQDPALKGFRGPIKSIRARDFSFQDPGLLYQVNVGAKPGDFMNLEKQLNLQSPAVQKAVSEFGISPLREGGEAAEDMSRALDPNYTPPKGGGGYPKALSDYLMGKDVPGFTWSGYGQQGASKPNYNVFDSNILTVLQHMYGPEEAK